MIPKIIHYCWFSKDKNKELPLSVKQSIESWKNHLPDYEIMLWNEDTFNINSIPYTRECYESGIASYAYLTDYVRLYALYNYGGIYLDADQIVYKSLNPLLDNKMFVGMINDGELGWGIVGAEKHNSTIKYLLDKFTNLHYINPDNTLNIKNSIYRLTDWFKESIPIRDDKSVLQVHKDCIIYPKEYFYSNIDNVGYTNHLGLCSHYKTVSVVMPVYNGEKYIKEAIDSVLNQTFSDFEFIIVDDGSTDNTSSIIKSYKDDRIVYIKGEHKGISEALNLGIKRSIGLYIARMDADDIMYIDRLEKQLKYFKDNPSVDIIGAGFEWGNNKPEKEYYKPTTGEISKSRLLLGNCIAHPTVMMKSSSIKKLPFLYESLYDGAEDYKLWLTAVTHGLILHNISDIVLYYRQHDNQVTNSFKSFDTGERIKSSYNKLNSSSLLTVIIPFQNEGYEIEKTLMSIRYTTKDINIMIINDQSYDEYDYESMAKLYHCDYYKTSENLGVAGARDFGISKCKTPYFILLDGHMRFYDNNWEDKIIELLKINEKRLITSNTVYFTKDKYGNYVNEEGSSGRDYFGTYAASVNMEEPGWEFTAKWTAKLINKEEEVVPVSCVLGAFYASSVKWWNYIGGLKGLIKYGLDEPLMSIKTWLAGGEVLLIKNFGVGHYYRESNPYKVYPSHLWYNQLFLIHLFSSGDTLLKYEDNLQKRIGINSFNKVKELLDKNASILKEAKDNLNKISVFTLDKFLKLNSLVS